MASTEPGNTRDPVYKRQLKEHGEKGTCPFCTDFPGERPILSENEDWLALWCEPPYDNTARHILIVYRKHVRGIEEISPHVGAKFWSLLQRLTRELQIEGGGIGMRFGDPERAGTTVHHLHAHLIVPEAGKAVHFGIGPLPKD